MHADLESPVCLLFLVCERTDSYQGFCGSSLTDEALERPVFWRENLRNTK